MFKRVAIIAAALVALCAPPAAAQQKSQTQLLAEIGSYIPDNAQGLVTPVAVRTVLADMLTSTLAIVPHRVTDASYTIKLPSASGPGDRWVIYSSTSQTTPGTWNLPDGMPVSTIENGNQWMPLTITLVGNATWKGTWKTIALAPEQMITLNSGADNNYYGEPTVAGHATSIGNVRYDISYSKIALERNVTLSGGPATAGRATGFTYNITPNPVTFTHNSVGGETALQVAQDLYQQFCASGPVKAWIGADIFNASCPPGYQLPTPFIDWAELYGFQASVTINNNDGALTEVTAGGGTGFAGPMEHVEGASRGVLGACAPGDVIWQRYTVYDTSTQLAPVRLALPAYKIDSVSVTDCTNAALKADWLTTVDTRTIQGKLGITSDASKPTSLLHLKGQGPQTVTHDSYAGASFYSPRRADGTVASPTAVVANDQLFSLAPQGFNGASYTNSGGFAGYATETYTGAHSGFRWGIFTTPTGTNSIAEVARIDQDGTIRSNRTGDIWTNAPNPLSGVGLQVLGTNLSAGAEVTSFANPSFLYARRIDGTPASAVALGSGEQIGGISAQGYKGDVSASAGALIWTSNQPWGTTAAGSYVSLFAVPNGATSAAEIMRWFPSSANGGFGVIINNGLGTTITDGLILENLTAAGAGAQQESPALHLIGQGWKTNSTAGSQTVDWVLVNLPVQGAANPSSQLVFSHQENGGGYSQGMSITSGGVFNAGTAYTVGGSVASAGRVIRSDGVNGGVFAQLSCSDLSTACLTTLTVGSTTITSGSSGRVLYDNAGVLGEATVTGTLGNVVLSGSPIIVTPTFTTSATVPLIVGGSAANSGVELRSTSGTGSGDVVFLTGGTNGATRLATFLGSQKAGIGTETNPQFPFVVSQNAATGIGSLGASLSSPLALFAAVDGTVADVVISAFGTGIFPRLDMNQSRGTAASKTATQATDLLFILNGQGWDATNGYLRNGGISLSANSNFTSTSHETYLSLNVTASGATIGAEAVRVFSSTGVGLGTFGTDPGAGSMVFNGQLYGPNIATTASAANAFINTGSSPAGQLLRSTSSGRYKHRVDAVSPFTALWEVMRLVPVGFHSLASADNPDQEFIGLISEEVAAVDPRLVNFTRVDEWQESHAYERGNIVKFTLPDGLVTYWRSLYRNADKRPDLFYVYWQRAEKPTGDLIPEGVEYDRVSLLMLAVVKHHSWMIALSLSLLFVYVVYNERRRRRDRRVFSGVRA